MGFQALREKVGRRPAPPRLALKGLGSRAIALFACLHDFVLLRCPSRLLILWEKAEGSGPRC